MKVLINKINHKVVGINKFVTPFEFSIEADQDFNINKSISIMIGMKKKLNDKGEVLYKDNEAVDPDTGLITFDEVTYSSKVVSYKEVPMVYKSIDEHGEVHDVVTSKKVPLESMNLNPVMIEDYQQKIVELSDQPHLFTAGEVLSEVYQTLLDESNMDYLLADVFLSEEDIDLDSSSHSANTGPGLVQLLPNGQCKLKQTDLEASSDKFELIELKADVGVEVYIAGKKFENGALSLSNAIESCTIKFINTTDKPAYIYSYAIGYQEAL